MKSFEKLVSRYVILFALLIATPSILRIVESI